MSGDNHNQADQTVLAVARAMEGAMVSVGGRDDAGDDAWLTGCLDLSERKALARLILADPAAVAAIRGEVAS